MAIHNCCQRSQMRCRRTLEGVEKWLCSVSEREIRPDCGVLIIDRHLLSNTSCWSALERRRRPDRYRCACPPCWSDLLLECLDGAVIVFSHTEARIHLRSTRGALSLVRCLSEQIRLPCCLLCPLIAPSQNKTRCRQSLEHISHICYKGMATVSIRSSHHSSGLILKVNC